MPSLSKYANTDTNKISIDINSVDPIIRICWKNYWTNENAELMNKLCSDLEYAIIEPRFLGHSSFVFYSSHESINFIAKALKDPELKLMKKTPFDRHLTIGVDYVKVIIDMLEKQIRIKTPESITNGIIRQMKLYEKITRANGKDRFDYNDVNDYIVVSILNQISRDFFCDSRSQELSLFIYTFSS